MNIKTTFAVLALMVAPGLALAQGCSERGMRDSAAMSCAEGMILDAATNTCVPVTNS